MNVIFLTSSTSTSVFKEMCSQSKVLPNPSNQNFYRKLIKSVSFYENVEVVSHQPCAKGIHLIHTEKDFEGQISYYYTSIHHSLFYKLFKEKHEIVNTTMKLLDSHLHKDCVIVVDVLRRNLLNAALHIKHRLNIPVIGMLTDNPLNLSGSSLRYSENILKKSKKLDGFLSLSKGLNYAFDIQDKPSYIFEGIVEDIPTFKKEPLGEYIGFAGSLYERYGVKNLIDSFTKLNKNINLVILGNGPLKSYISHSGEEDHRILYLSQVSQNKTYAIEQHALANINPRPVDDLLDQQSIPSKMLDYLASGAPTISTKHKRLYELFKEDVYWIDDSSPKGIQKTIEEFISTSNVEKTKKALSAKTKVYSMYGCLVQGEGISHFLKSFSTPKS